jgi:aspartate/methionine/tyrosine aminotransferase
MFSKYVESLLASKRLEVCSTTMPQLSIPRIMGDARYPGHLRKRAGMFEARAREAHAALQGIPGVTVNIPNGAFYLTVGIDPGVLNSHQTLKIENPEIDSVVSNLVRDVANDCRFVYYLMGATGICVVPLSGFCCKRDGFRVTLLECDPVKRKWIFDTLASALREYIAS